MAQFKYPSFFIDKPMCFEYINPFFTASSGYTKEELLVKSNWEALYLIIIIKRIPTIYICCTLQQHREYY
jgi:hypothetical protein